MSPEELQANGLPLFAHVPNSRSSKIMCQVCHRKGYSYGSWKDACRRGHAQCTRGCGKWMSLLPNGRPRTHTRCPLPKESPCPRS